MLFLKREKHRTTDDGLVPTISVNTLLDLPPSAWKADANFVTEYFLRYNTNTHHRTALVFYKHSTISKEHVLRVVS